MKEELIPLAQLVALIVLFVMQGRAANKAEAAKNELEASGRRRDQKLETIHCLVNSEMSKALAKIDKLQKQLALSRLSKQRRAFKEKREG